MNNAASALKHTFIAKHILSKLLPGSIQRNQTNDQRNDASYNNVGTNSWPEETPTTNIWHLRSILNQSRISKTNLCLSDRKTMVRVIRKSEKCFLYKQRAELNVKHLAIHEVLLPVVREIVTRPHVTSTTYNEKHCGRVKDTQYWQSFRNGLKTQENFGCHTNYQLPRCCQ